MKNNMNDTLDGSITEYVCVYGNSGRNLEQEYKNLNSWEFQEYSSAANHHKRSRKYWYISNNKAVIWALNKED